MIIRQAVPEGVVFYPPVANKLSKRADAINHYTPQKFHTSFGFFKGQ